LAQSQELVGSWTLSVIHIQTLGSLQNLDLMLFSLEELMTVKDFLDFITKVYSTSGDLNMSILGKKFKYLLTCFLLVMDLFIIAKFN
jgi:hypothetical protein